MDALIQRAAEFGLTAFLLVLVLCFTGWAVWQIGMRLVTATEKSMERQAAAADRTADAVLKISDLAASIHLRAEQIQVSLDDNNHRQANQHRAIRCVLKAVHELTPEQQSRVRGYLDDAARHLELEK